LANKNNYSEMQFDTFEDKIGVSFRDKSLLRQAFTHRSYINEFRVDKLEHNERLEFLGDAVLELATTDFLYKQYPDKNEGELTSLRAAVVNAITLSDIATSLGMDEYLLLSKGERKDTGKARQYILANTIEALIGAIYLDRGYDTAEEFITRTISSRLKGILEKGVWTDAKSLFQEKAQDQLGATPLYKVLKEIGPDHDKQFTSGVYLRDNLTGTGQGKSKQEAEQAAARDALQKKGWK